MNRRSPKPENSSTVSRIWKLRLLAMLGGLVVGGCLSAMLWGTYRLIGPSMTHRAAAAFDAMYAAAPAKTRSVLDAAGYGPRERLVCPANFDGALVFSSQVMEPHPQRGYRFRAGQSNLWVRVAELPYQILVPDSESVRAAIQQAGASETSCEQINSRGCRGPEWGDIASYDFRVLVLGDSFTEGILVPEQQTFCARLDSHLRSLTSQSVLVANAGVVGYSTEQEYYTMLELAPALKPDLVVLCFYVNDVHRDHHRVLESRRPVGDWQSARQWLRRCIQYCREASITFVIAAVPDKSQLGIRTGRQRYQHRLEEIASELRIYMIDPDERFLSQRRQPLYWPGDAHFAPAGHELFATILAEHLVHWARRE